MDSAKAESVCGKSHNILPTDIKSPNSDGWKADETDSAHCWKYYREEGDSITLFLLQQESAFLGQSMQQLEDSQVYLAGFFLFLIEEPHRRAASCLLDSHCSRLCWDSPLTGIIFLIYLTEIPTTNTVPGSTKSSSQMLPSQFTEGWGGRNCSSHVSGRLQDTRCTISKCSFYFCSSDKLYWMSPAKRHFPFTGNPFLSGGGSQLLCCKKVLFFLLTISRWT